jgi:hypothetical protein
MSVVVVRAFPAPGHRAEVIAAQARLVHAEGAVLAALRSALEAKFSCGLASRSSSRTWAETRSRRAVTARPQAITG